MKKQVSPMPQGSLDTDSQYQSQIKQFPPITEDRKRELLERALAGQDVYGEIVLLLQRPVWNLAYKVAERHLKGKEQALERMDLIQSANEELLRISPLALRKENPYSYLLRVAHLHMMKQIKQGSSRHMCGDDELLTLEDTSYKPSTQNEESYHLLYHAIHSLPSKQQSVILKFYGIGSCPESLNKISQTISSRSPKLAHYHHKRALQVLKQQMLLLSASARKEVSTC